MPPTPSLQPEQMDAMLSALQTERLHLLLVGSPEETQSVLSGLRAALGEHLPVVQTEGEIRALARTRSWLSALEGVAAPRDGWCANEEQDGRLSVAILTGTDALRQIGLAREALGHSTQFIIARDHSIREADREALISSLHHQVLEVQLAAQPSHGRPKMPYARLEAALVILILSLVGLSTLWLTDNAASDPVSGHAPPPVWSIRP
jgi:hypothetical protein